METREPESRFSTREAMYSLSKKFAWTINDDMPDWPFEIAQDVDIKKCIKSYYRLTDDEQFVLMEAMLFALNEIENALTFDKYALEISGILKTDFHLHEYTVYSWIRHNIEASEGIKVTPICLRVWIEMQK